MNNVIPIVIPTFNAVEHLQRCIATVEAQTTRPYQIYIADDCSPQTALHDFLDECVAKGRATVFKARTRKGFAEINNWAVAQVPDSDYICLMNSDIEPTAGWLTAMAEELDNDPKVGVVGARLLYPDTKEKPFQLTIQHAGVARTADNMPYHPFRGQLADFEPAAQRREINAVTFACVLIRRALWNEFGGLDEAYIGGNFEDVDFCWHARDKGWKVIYQPKATLYHYEHGSGMEWVELHSYDNSLLLRKRFAGLGSDEHLFNLSPTMSDGSRVSVILDDLSTIPAEESIDPPCAQPEPISISVPIPIRPKTFTFSVVLPVYNRREHLYLALCALDRCLDHYTEPIEVIVTDDGSTDDPLGVMLEFQNRFVLQYRWQEHKGYRASLAYNRGCAIARGDAFVLLGSDILLEQTSLAHLNNLRIANPAAIIAGRYDWMLPMKIRPYDIYTNWDAIVEGTLPPAQFGGRVKGIVGVDPRFLDSPELFEGAPQTQYAANLFADILMFPRDIYNELGGFDEEMVAHGGQDCELSIRCQQKGYPAIFTKFVHGYHMYHDRDQVSNRATLSKNVDYIAKKHNLAAVGLQIWGEGDDTYIVPSYKGGPK